MDESREVSEKGGFVVDETEVRVFSIDLRSHLKGVFGIDEKRRVAVPHNRIKGKKILTFFYDKTESTMAAIAQYYSPTNEQAKGAYNFRRAQVETRGLKRIMEGN